MSRYPRPTGSSENRATRVIRSAASQWDKRPDIVVGASAWTLAATGQQQKKQARPPGTTKARVKTAGLLVQARDCWEQERAPPIQIEP